MAETVVKTAIEMELKVTGADYAVRETQKLSAAQQKHAKDAAKAMDAFERDATAALKKVEKSVEAQEKAWKKAQKAMAEGGGIFDKVEDGIRKFNGTIGVFAMGLGALPKAIEVATTAVGYLGKAWDGLANTLSRPQLKMQWEKGAQDEFLAFAKKAAEAQQKWADAVYATYFGADVESDKSVARRRAGSAELRRQQAEREGAVDYWRTAQLEQQKRDIQDQLDRANRTGPYARKETPRRGGGGDPYEHTGRVITAAEMAAAAADYNDRDVLVDSMDPTRREYDAVSGFGDITAGMMAPGSAERQPTILQRMFGEAEEIDGYTRAWGTLESAVTAGYEALVTGSESAGAAIKKVIAQSIMAEGSRMMVKALREGAEAIASLAEYDYPAAARHGLAAAKFLAGAAAAGVAASALGGGGGASAGAVGAGGGGGSPGYRPTTESGPQTNIYVIGDSYGEETARSRSLRFERQRRMAQSYESPPRDMEYA